MTIAKCAFCGKEQEDHRGTYLAKNDGTLLYFSSSKCMKNHLKLKRDKRKVRWAEAFYVTRTKRAERAKVAAEKDAARKAEKADGKKKKAIVKRRKK